MRKNWEMRVNIDWRKIWDVLHKYVVNKYIVTLVIFALVMIFVGEQSYRVRIKKARQIRELEAQRDAYQAAIDQAHRDLQNLQSTDSLERFAREKYLMHTDKEDVYLVDE